jgi:hypothetical protein
VLIRRGSWSSGLKAEYLHAHWIAEQPSTPSASEGVAGDIITINRQISRDNAENCHRKAKFLTPSVWKRKSYLMHIQTNSAA